MRGRFSVFRVIINTGIVRDRRVRSRTRKRQHSQQIILIYIPHIVRKQTTTIDGRQRLPLRSLRRTYGGNPSSSCARAPPSAAHIWPNVITIIILLSCRIAHSAGKARRCAAVAWISPIGTVESSHHASQCLLVAANIGGIGTYFGVFAHRAGVFRRRLAVHTSIDRMHA